ncbi:hypothetical protein D3C73_1161070 [compost metagenome]
MLALLQRLQNLLGIRKKLLPLLRQLNLLAQPIEQPAIQLPLQRLDAGRHRGLGQEQHLRRLVKAAIVMDVDESLQILDVHADQPPFEDTVLLLLQPLLIEKPPKAPCLRRLGLSGHQRGF